MQDSLLYRILAKLTPAERSGPRAIYTDPPESAAGTVMRRQHNLFPGGGYFVRPETLPVVSDEFGPEMAHLE